MTFATIAPRSAVIAEIGRAAVRCLCPECLRLDALHPGEGYQLALFPYRITAPVLRRQEGIRP